MGIGWFNEGTASRRLQAPGAWDRLKLPLPTMKMSFGTMLCCACVAALASAASAADFTGDVTDVRVIRTVQQEPGASLVWEPYLAVWKPHYLVAAYGAGIPGKTDMGDLLVSVSKDDGDTWSEPVTVFDHRVRHDGMQFAYANTILYHPPGQDVLWLFGMRCPMDYPNSEDGQLVGAFSADGGLSWTPVEMAMKYHGPLIVVAGVECVMEQGHPRYLLPAHRNTARSEPLGTRDQFVLSSTSLLDWSLAGFVPQPASGPVFLHEGGIAPGDKQGELKMVMRTATYNEKAALNPPRAFSTVSEDGGRTWSPAKQEDALWNARSKAYFGKTADGRHLYVYSDGPMGRRTSLRYKVQGTDGVWGPEKTFYDSGTKNSYPTLVEVAPNEYVAVWDSGTPDKARTHICFGKLRVK